MSKRKGVSAEEKRTRLLQLFYEKKEVYQLKDLEKIAPKEKGIVAQSVKDVLQSLVDDGLVDTDKIGTSVYFWAFPSKAGNIRKTKISELKSKIGDSRKKVKVLEESVAKAKVGREDDDQREELLENLNRKEVDLAKLKTELQKYRDFDPDVLDSMKNEADVAKESANRWTDNIYSIKSWCKKKFNVEETQINKMFGIPDDLDYID